MQLSGRELKALLVRKRRNVLIAALVLTVLIFSSALLIDSGEPQLVGATPLSSKEVKEMRRVVLRQSASMPFYWLRQGDIAASFASVKELYTYRVNRIEVKDEETAWIYTTETYYSNGMRRPDFVARRVGADWEIARMAGIL
jgi:hypothetical protein